MSSTIPSLVCSLLYLSWTVSISLGQSGTRCQPPDGSTSSCMCQTLEGVIDVTPLSSSSGPMYTGMMDPNQFAYSFNPCKTFSEPDECSGGVYVCQLSQDGTYHYSIADSQEQFYIDNDNTPYLYYTGPGFRETYVYLNCDPSRTDPKDADVTTIGDSGSYLIYHFTVKTAFACPGHSGGGGGGGNKAGVAGIVIIILLLAGVVTYFVVGAIIMKVHYQKNGTDLIINKIFWFALPGLIKEGFVFTFKPCFDIIRRKRQGYKAEL